MTGKAIQSCIQYIKKNLLPVYDENEISSLTKIIFEYLIDADSLYIHTHPDEILEDGQLVQLEEIVKQLKNHKPIQYITGQAHFYGLDFDVTPDTLIPRQETEELANWIVKNNSGKAGLKILDIGTGSGCIAISLAKNLPYAETDVTDISDKALIVALKNAKKHDVILNYYLFDLFNFNNISFHKKYDVIVSNPPYIRESEKKMIKKNVLEFEPHQALFVPDASQLAFYEAIADFGISHLVKDGGLYLELNEFLHAEIQQVIEKKGYQNIQIREDLNGKKRMLYAQKKK